MGIGIGLPIFFTLLAILLYIHHNRKKAPLQEIDELSAAGVSKSFAAPAGKMDV